MKDGEKLITRNWVMEKVEMDNEDYVEVQTSSGDFHVMYKAGTMMYFLLTSVESDDKETLESLAVMFSNIYSAASIVDGGFQHDVLSATVKFLEKAESEEIPEEENQRIINEERTNYDVAKGNA